MEKQLAKQSETPTTNTPKKQPACVYLREAMFQGK
jgi:hypothetical protein